MKSANQEVFISAEFLRESSPDELVAAIDEAQQKLLELRSEANFAPLGKPHLVKAYKKLIARAKTILRESR